MYTKGASPYSQEPVTGPSVPKNPVELLSVSVSTIVPVKAMKAYGGNWYCAPIIQLGSKRSALTTFTPPPLHSRQQESPVTAEREAGLPSGPVCLPCRRQNFSWPWLESNRDSLVVQSVTSSLYRLRYPGSLFSIMTHFNIILLSMFMSSKLTSSFGVFDSSADCEFSSLPVFS
jgi:hypothetical protein